MRRPTVAPCLFVSLLAPAQLFFEAVTLQMLVLFRILLVADVRVLCSRQSSVVVAHSPAPAQLHAGRHGCEMRGGTEWAAYAGQHRRTRRVASRGFGKQHSHEQRQLAACSPLARAHRGGYTPAPPPLLCILAPLSARTGSEVRVMEIRFRIPNAKET